MLKLQMNVMGENKGAENWTFVFWARNISKLKRDYCIK